MGKSPVFLLTLPILGSGALSAVHAQPPTEQSRLGQIDITVTRSQLPLDAIAESVSVVDTETLQRKQVSNISDILEDLPNVDIGSGPRALGEEFNIRGLGDKRILFLVDGARQNFDSAHKGRIFLEPEVLRQVEVLRGPASALWGSGALGGVVAFTTKDAVDFLRPGETFGAHVKAGYQTVNNEGLGSSVLYGTIGETLDLIGQITHRESDNIELGNDTTLPNSSANSLAGFGKVTWMPTPDHTLALSLQTLDHRGDIPTNTSTNVTNSNPLVDRDTEQRNINFSYDYDNPDKPWLQLHATVYHNITEIDEDRIGAVRQDSTRLTTSGFDVRNSLPWETAAIKHTTTFGVEYYEDRAKGTRDGADRTSFPNAKARINGFYVQNEMLWDRLAITPGIRIDSYEAESNSNIAADQDESEVSAKLGASWKASDWLTLVGSYNEAFRAPSPDELYVSGTHFNCGPGCANLFVPNPNLRPEKAHNLEAGFRSRFEDAFSDGADLSFNATAFRNQVDDFIDQIVNFTFAPVPGNPGLGGTTTNRNVRDARLTGYEMDVRWARGDLILKAAYSSTRGKDETTGQPLSDIPADKWVLNADWKVPGQDLYLGLQTSIVDDQNRIPTTGTATPGYTLHDISLSWQPQGNGLDKLRVDFGIDNLTDRDYRKHLAVLREPGRNFKATVSYQF